MTNINYKPVTFDVAQMQAARCNNGEFPGYLFLATACPQCGCEMEASRDGLRVIAFECRNHSAQVAQRIPEIESAVETVCLLFEYHVHTGVLELYRVKSHGFLSERDGHSVRDLLGYYPLRDGWVVIAPSRKE